MMYLTYDEFSAMGRALDVDAFNAHIRRACGIIDNATHSRVKAMSAPPDEVKALCRELVEYLAANTAAQGNVQTRSQSSGTVSESISYAAKTKAEKEQEFDDMIFDYLASVKDDSGTPLLYRGCGS